MKLYIWKAKNQLVVTMAENEDKARLNAEKTVPKENLTEWKDGDAICLGENQAFALTFEDIYKDTYAV